MKLFKSADERFIEKIEKEEKQMLKKFYNLELGDANCPSKPYLLNPKRLIATSYEKISFNTIKINIGYKTHWSGYVANTVRMSYDQIIRGAIYCEGVEKIEEIPFNRIGTIEIPFLSTTKSVNIPVQQSFNIAIKCKRIRVESIDIFVEHEGKLILDDQFKKEYTLDN